VKRCCKQGFHYSDLSQKTLHCEDFGSLSAVRTIEPSRPDTHLTTVPSVRTTCHTARTLVRPSIICPDDVHFRPDPPLCREGSIQLASIRTFQQHVRTPLSTRPVSDSSKFRKRKDCSTVQTMSYPVRTRVYVRQESQFKYPRPEVCESWFGRACN
jgi:hypothetical protein